MTSTVLPTALTTPAPQTPADAPAGAAALAVALAIRTDLWADRVEYREQSRWTALLDPADVVPALDPSLHAELRDAQIWLLSWLPGQGTPLHDHGASAGAFAVARGTLTERVVARGTGTAARQSTADLAAGRVRFFGSHYVHQVVNTLHEPAVSVHVYAPRLTLMNTYRIEGGRLVRTGTERAGVDW
ncbi:cysteine dioxygenase [Klenkia taihuensis]|uniref:Cysteine dioxygenase type I n=1 Tax=Klenkia taihuensis TaxID=1225127 RepID=A0A1I1I3R0_9ACTN|nr:cysteine dioxygenase family protein [Klenkia taihuensis]GHE08858.1 cysteine dioxygenase [Klenkia taihuensis]SFC30721.1 Cysteine dioxygenase type I [Klenkia taihuensis]